MKLSYACEDIVSRGFFSQLKAIIMLKLISNPANSNNVHFFLRVSRKREVVNIVGGHIINT